MITKEQADRAYEEGSPLMTDEEYDRRFGLQATGEFLDPESPWEKVPHQEGDGTSLSKIPTVNESNEVDLLQVKEWMEGCRIVAEEMGQPLRWVATPKYDGISLSLWYSNGVLVRALTKGKGGTGEDILRNVLKMKEVHRKISFNFTGVVKAEALLTRSAHQSHLREVYDNTRNGTSGAAKAFDGKHAHHLTLFYYGVRTTPPLPPSDQMRFVRRELSPSDFIEFEGYGHLEAFYNDYLLTREALDYDIDGIVLTVDNPKIQDALGRDSNGRPRWSVALKFPYASRRSRVKEILWQPSKTGTITPVALVDPVELSGAMVRRANLCNLDEMTRLRVCVGDEVLVSRRGDVIPKIESNFSHHEDYVPAHPTHCPSCGAETQVEGPFLKCPNSDCSATRFQTLLGWINVLKEHFMFKGLGPERLQQIYDLGLARTIPELYRLTEEVIIENLPGVESASAKNILSFQSHQDLPLSVFLSALSIPGWGKSLFDLLVSEGYDTLEKLFSVPELQLQLVPGIGESRAGVLSSALRSRKETMEEILKQVRIDPPRARSGSLVGKSFCFTGTLSQPRKHFEKMVEDRGGSLKSVSKTLDFLVVGEDAGSKLAKAKNGFTTILSEEEFLRLIRD